MSRVHNLLRPACRRLAARAWRPLDRATVRRLPGCRRRPDSLSHALTAFSRAIRCHQRLAKLVPSFFDSAVVDREARERDDHRRWMESWQPLLEKVYGPPLPSDPPRPIVSDYLPPLPGVRTRQAVERELAGWDFWMALGCEALARHKLRRPHALPTSSQLVRLLRVGSDFGRLACGLPIETRPPP